MHLVIFHYCLDLDASVGSIGGALGSLEAPTSHHLEVFGPTLEALGILHAWSPLDHIGVIWVPLGSILGPCGCPNPREIQNAILQTQQDGKT